MQDGEDGTPCSTSNQHRFECVSKLQILEHSATLHCTMVGLSVVILITPGELLRLRCNVRGAFPRSPGVLGRIVAYIIIEKALEPNIFISYITVRTFLLDVCAYECNRTMPNNASARNTNGADRLPKANVILLPQYSEFHIIFFSFLLLLPCGTNHIDNFIELTILVSLT